MDLETFNTLIESEFKYLKTSVTKRYKEYKSFLSFLDNKFPTS